MVSAYNQSLLQAKNVNSEVLEVENLLLLLNSAI